MRSDAQSGLGPDAAAPRDASTLPDATRRALAHRLARAQSECRLPSAVAAAVHDGRLAWTGGAGQVAGASPTESTQYRIGSITKTLTAVLVMRLRDEGRLGLEDVLESHAPGTPLGDRTILSLLSHTSGLQAETAGPWWERTAGVPREELTAGLTHAAVLRPAGSYHYSNLGYALLGGVIEHHRQRRWIDAVREELLLPLGMTRTSYDHEGPHADGFAVHPWADAVLPEPSAAHDSGAMAPAGQLWASITDLARWGRFLAGDTADVLSSDTLEEMCEPVSIHDDEWAVGHGLGVQVFRRGVRRWVGHGGSMPGFLAHLVVDRGERAAAAVAANATSGLDDAAGDLLARLVENEPRTPDPWVPDDIPPGLLDVLGPWYWGPTPVTLQFTGGHLRLAALKGRARESRFIPAAAEPRGPGRHDVWTGLDGYYRGETLRIVRADDGTPTHLELATFVFTRVPYDPDAPVPGGVDPTGWGRGRQA